MKVLVLGASGMAGHLVALYLRESGFNVDTLSGSVPLDKNTKIIDVLDLLALKDFLLNKDYDVVVNCIGVLVNKSESHKDMAIYINSFLPRFLERYFSESRTRIIHLSTDAVFAGDNSQYSEESQCNPVDFYGKTKLLGEIDNHKDLTIRLSIIGPELKSSGVGLFTWFNAQSGVISGYKNVFWTGVTTLELAKAIKFIINHNFSGVYHLVPNGYVTKLDLLALLKKEFGLRNIILKPTESKTFGRRLVCSRTDIDFEVSDYKAMIKELKTWIRSHSYLYNKDSAGKVNVK